MTPTDIRQYLLTAFDLNPLDLEYGRDEIDPLILACWDNPTDQNLAAALDLLK